MNGSARCDPTPEQEEGPYYRELPLERADVVEDRVGDPLELIVRVLDDSCAPVADAAIDIWHCDALGLYSWYAADGEEDDVGPASLVPGTFLRGIQRSDADGICRFRTIYPGWYPGRTVHIHAKAGTGAAPLTVQLYFPDEITDEVHRLAPYSARERRDTTNDQDTIFPQGRGSTLMTVTPAATGHRAEAELVVVTS